MIFGFINFWEGKEKRGIFLYIYFFYSKKTGAIFFAKKNCFFFSFFGNKKAKSDFKIHVFVLLF
jgi:hypothetical protein